jgi:O-antigen ligase
MERLTFNTRATRAGALGVVVGRNRRRTAESALPGAAPAPTESQARRLGRRIKLVRERYDSDYLWMLTFTALLFFRPQDQIPGLAALHLVELTAIAGLGSMAVRRLGAGLSVAKVNAEVAGVIALGAVIVLTIPFSFWPGGSAHVFSDIYVKIILIFALMMSTLTTPKRLHQLTWLMIVASSYVAGRAVLDYLRGVNLVEGDRVRGAIGGMFQNPNDLALNLVTFLAPTLFIIVQDRKPVRRMLASVFAVTMLAAIVCTKSRSGFLGLLAVCVVVGYYTIRMRPGLFVAALFAGLLALPAMPQSFWNRMDSIMNAEEDQSGSREARLRLLTQGVEVFTENPLTGVGAGQFQNYNVPGETIERWRVTHNVWLQVACDLGIFGLLTFGFLVIRSYKACFATLAALRPPRKRRAAAARAGGTPARTGTSPPPPALTDEERFTLDMNAKSMLAAMVGWTVCSMFASVAFNWTFYYVFALAVAGREIVVARRTAAAPEQSAVSVGSLVRAHA